jgi:hypothetical protein
MPREEDVMSDEEEEANELGEKENPDVKFFELLRFSSLFSSFLRPLNALGLCFRGPLSC